MVDLWTFDGERIETTGGCLAKLEGGVVGHVALLYFSGIYPWSFADTAGVLPSGDACEAGIMN